MAGNSKACFTVISYEENYKLFDTTVQQEIEFWKSQKVSGVAVGLHHKEINDKNHEHWMLGYAKSAPDVSGFIDLLKSRNAELQERAKASGKDISIVLESGEVVERCMYKIYTGRYAKKHCVYDPESMELYLSHSTPQCKKDGKVQYDPDRDVIYSDGFDLDSYLSRDAIQKSKGNKEDKDVDLLDEITDIIDTRHVRHLPSLIRYLKSKNLRHLLSFCIAHTAIVTSYIADMRHLGDGIDADEIDFDKAEADFPHGTNSVDAGQKWRQPRAIDGDADPGCLKSEIFHIIQDARLAIDDELYNKFFEVNSHWLMDNSCNEHFADIVLAKYRCQIVTPAADAPAEEAPAPADADSTCVESKEANSTYARESAPEDAHVPSVASVSVEAREADTSVTPDIEHVTPEMLKGLKSVRRASSDAVKTSSSSRPENRATSSTAEDALMGKTSISELEELGFEFYELDIDPFQ